MSWFSADKELLKMQIYGDEENSRVVYISSIIMLIILLIKKRRAGCGRGRGAAVHCYQMPPPKSYDFCLSYDYEARNGRNYCVNWYYIIMRYRNQVPGMPVTYDGHYLKRQAALNITSLTSDARREKQELVHT